MFIEIGIIILLFSMGYLLGRLKKFETSVSIFAQNSLSSEMHHAQQKQSETLQNDVSRVQYKDEDSKIQSKIVKIDDSKFVTNVSTDSFKKDFDSLGDKTTKEDDISKSISKLSQLKNKK